MPSTTANSTSPIKQNWLEIQLINWTEGGNFDEYNFLFSLAHSALGLKEGDSKAGQDEDQHLERQVPLHPVQAQQQRSYCLLELLWIQPMYARPPQHSNRLNGVPRLVGINDGLA